MENIDKALHSIFIGVSVANYLLKTGRALKAIGLCKECLFLLLNIEENEEEYNKLVNSVVCRTMFNAYCLIHDFENATKYGRKLLVLYHELFGGVMEGRFTATLANIYKRHYKYAGAKELYEKAIDIMIERGERKGEAGACEQLGIICYHLSEYAIAQKNIKKALAIRVEIGDRRGEAICYVTLGTVFATLGKYAKSQEYTEKALAINVEIGDREVERGCYGNLGAVFKFLGEYAKAQQYMEKALAIGVEMGDKEIEAEDYRNLGVVLKYLYQYAKAQEYIEKALAITVEIGNKAGEAACYGHLGTLFRSLGEYDKAQEYLEKALLIEMEIGDRKGGAADYGNLGTVFTSRGEYAKAQEHIEKALVIKVEIGDREGEAADYGNLGTVFVAVGKYTKAQEYIEKALAIKVEIGDRKGEAADYVNLGTVFKYLGEYAKAQEYIEKALAITVEIGNKAGEAACYRNLGSLFESLGKYAKAQNNVEKALTINMEIGERKQEAECYGKLGSVFTSLGKYTKAQEYIEKALAIRVEIGDRGGEAVDCANLGTMFQCLGEYEKAKEYYGKALSICKDIGDGKNENSCYVNLFYLEFSQGKVLEAFNYLSQSIRKSEELRVLIEDNDQFKILFSDLHHVSYQNLSRFFCAARKHKDALLVEELGRGRALADLIETQYSLENKQFQPSPNLWIENVMRKETKCTCMYITYGKEDVSVWIISATGVIHFREIEVNEDIFGAEFVPSLDDFFDKMFRRFVVLPEENCEDRSLNDNEPKLKSCQDESIAALRPVEEDGEESQDLESSLSLCYRMFIDPVVDLLNEPEIIVVPYRSLNQVPFAALRDKDGKYLSETFRIRIVPSLSTLKLIQDCPADYHSQTGALIVGDPRVGQVFYKGYLTSFRPLEFARKEAEMVGRLLGVQPLLGECATKRAVLDKIHSVSLIHFAAHGNAQSGEIALAPTVRSATRPPADKDYLLTMPDISKIQLRAKLVVLSCCHSGCGQIRAEGVVGIARAFLGSGARSVLVALWALEDRATEQIMNRFYEHLAAGESASESLHEAMKWMRGNGFPEVKDWAPFILIGDNVTFDFGRKRTKTDEGKVEGNFEASKKQERT